MLDALKELSSRLNALDIAKNPKGEKAIASIKDAFNKAAKKLHKSKEAVNFKQTHIFNALTQIGDELHHILGYLNDHPNSDHAISLIQSLCRLNLPMDFPIPTKSEPDKTLGDIIAQFCDHAVQNQQSQFNFKQCTLTLSSLVNIDTESTPALASSSKRLADILCTQGYDHFNYLRRKTKEPNKLARNCVQLLWAHAYNSVDNTANYRPVLSSQAIKAMLEYIDDHLEIDAISARQLFQVYCANYQNSADFPISLFKKMESFIPEFKSTAHDSNFEKELKTKFTEKRTGAFEKLQKFSFINWRRCFDFNNPITFFGLETDYLFTDKATNINVAIQVDGDNFHCTPMFDKNSAKSRTKKTIFRDFCFMQLGYVTLNLSDSKRDYITQIYQFLVEHAVLPIHHELQKNKLNSIEDALEETATEKRRLHTALEQKQAQQQLAVEKFEQAKHAYDELLEKAQNVKMEREVMGSLDAEFELTLNSQIQALKEIVEQKQQHLQENQLAIQDIEGQIATLESDLGKKINQQMEEYRSMVVDLKPIINGLDLEVLKLEEEVAEAQEKFEKVKKKKEIVDKKNEKFDIEIQKIKKRIPFINELERLPELQKAGKLIDAKIEPHKFFEIFPEFPERRSISKGWYGSTTKKKVDALEKYLELASDPSTHPLKKYLEQIQALEEQKDSTSKIDEELALVDNMLTEIRLQHEATKKELAHYNEFILTQENPHKKLTACIEKDNESFVDKLNALEETIPSISTDVDVADIAKLIDEQNSILEKESKKLAKLRRKAKALLLSANELSIELQKLGVIHLDLELNLQEMNELAVITVSQMKKLKEVLGEAKAFYQDKVNELKERMGKIKEEIEAFRENPDMCLLAQKLDTCENFILLQQIQEEFEALKEKIEEEKRAKTEEASIPSDSDENEKSSENNHDGILSEPFPSEGSEEESEEITEEVTDFEQEGTTEEVNDEPFTQEYADEYVEQASVGDAAEYGDYYGYDQVSYVNYPTYQDWDYGYGYSGYGQTNYIAYPYADEYAVQQPTGQYYNGVFYPTYDQAPTEPEPVVTQERSPSFLAMYASHRAQQAAAPQRSRHQQQQYMEEHSVEHFRRVNY